VREERKSFCYYKLQLVFLSFLWDLGKKSTKNMTHCIYSIASRLSDSSTCVRDSVAHKKELRQPCVYGIYKND
jgi:hypothetical protein